MRQYSLIVKTTKLAFITPYFVMGTVSVMTLQMRNQNYACPVPANMVTHPDQTQNSTLTLFPVNTDIQVNLYVPSHVMAEMTSALILWTR